MTSCRWRLSFLSSNSPTKCGEATRKMCTYSFSTTIKCCHLDLLPFGNNIMSSTVTTVGDLQKCPICSHIVLFSMLQTQSHYCQVSIIITTQFNKNPYEAGRNRCPGNTYQHVCHECNILKLSKCTVFISRSAAQQMPQGEGVWSPRSIKPIVLSLLQCFLCPGKCHCDIWITSEVQIQARGPWWRGFHL